MSNSYDEASTIDFLDENERPALDLVALHQRLEADGAAWRRTLPSADALLQRLARNGIRQREMTAADERMNARNDAPDDAPSDNRMQWRAPATISRVQGIAAVSAALVVVLLFGLLIHIFTGAYPATSVSTPTAVTTAVATASVTAGISGRWNRLNGLTLTSAPSILTGQSGMVAIAPSDPQVVYESTQSPPSLRRTHDSGATWQQLSLPISATNVVAIQLYVSPLDSKIVFMTLSTFTSVGATSHCLTGPIASAPQMHGGVLASGSSWCDTTYLSVNSGATWKILVLPEPGAITNGVASLLGVAQNPIQAQGKSLYALVTCSDCSGNGNNLMKSADGGRSWKVTGPQQENICAFSAIPDHTTIFAASTAGPCGISNGGVGESSILRSDDGGAHWTLSGVPPNNGLVGLAATYLPGSDSPMLYVESPSVEQQGDVTSFKIDASAFFASVDGGQRWVQAPPNAATLPQIGSYATRIITSADGAIALAFTETSGDAESTVLYTWKVGQQAWRAASRTLAAQGYLLASIGTNYWAAVIANGFQTTKIYRYES